MKKRLKMNLQFFAESTGEGTEPQNQNNQSGKEPSAGPQIDYDKIQQMLEGTLAAKENTALKAYFKQQGLSQEEAEQAMQTFKQQKEANTPNIEAIQTQARNAQEQATKAMIERDAYMMSGELGIDLKTMPYVLKMVDLSDVMSEDKAAIDSEKLKAALNKVLEDVPQLKPQEQHQSGFRQIGVGESQGSNGAGTNTAQKKEVAVKRWNRWN